MRIGITGATGFIGQALAKAACDRGHGIVVFSRRKDLFLPWAKEIRPYDADSPTVLDPSGLDALVHLGGESVLGYWTAKKKARIMDSRVETTRRIVDAMKACPKPPATFLCASGTGAYGDQGDTILTETSKRGTGFLADVCSEWESAACRATPLGVRVVLLRTGMVLGPKGGSWPLLRRVFKLRIGSRLGSGKQWVPWVHLEDEAGMILKAIETPQISGPINLVSPNPVTNKEMTQIIAKQLGTMTLPPVPGFLLKLVMGELSSIVLDSQRVLPQTAQSHGYQFKFETMEAALANFEC